LTGRDRAGELLTASIARLSFHRPVHGIISGQHPFGLWWSHEL